MTDFFEYTRTSQRALYEEYFVVNNTTIVLVGGVSLDEMIPRVERYFGWMEAAPEPSRTPAIEPRPAAERRVVYRNDEIDPRVEYRYLIPGVGHPDRPAFDVLGRIAAARLADATGEQGIDTEVKVNTRVVHTDRFGVPATINFELVLDSEADLAEAEALLSTTLASLTTAPAPEEVTRSQESLRTEWYRTARDAGALAFEIGHFQTMDSWQTLQRYLDARDDTTPADIARLSKRYFIDDNRTVGIARSRSHPATTEATP